MIDHHQSIYIMKNDIRNKTMIRCLFFYLGFFSKRSISNTWPFISFIYDVNYDIYMYLRIVLINRNDLYKS